MKIIHVITALEMGGAESMLHRLLASLDQSRYPSQVISIAPPGPMAASIAALGVPVRSLNVRHPAAVPLAVKRLARLLREERPDLLQTWMYHADLVGGLAGRLAGTLPTVWNIRHGTLEPGSHKRSTILTANACAYLSFHVPTRIISCSRAAKSLHAERGYDARRMVVIPNGFDTATFRPDTAARRAIRQELGLPTDALLIGLAARFDPQKDHRSFFQAAARLWSENPEVHFVLCGDDMTWENAEVAGWIDDMGIRQQCHLLGRRRDMPRLQASFDIATLSSRSGEGFPNVLGEAMACGVPCVATDVGDAGWIVGDTGRIVPPRDPLALAAAWGELVRKVPDERAALGDAARSRIRERFSLPAVVDAYEALYHDVVHAVPPSARPVALTLEERRV